MQFPRDAIHGVWQLQVPEAAESPRTDAPSEKQSADFALSRFYAESWFHARSKFPFTELVLRPELPRNLCPEDSCKRDHRPAHQPPLPVRGSAINIYLSGFRV